MPAQHGPEGCEPLTGDVTGFILSGAGLPTVYVSGDNASLDIVGDIAERIGTIDVALLFAGAARVAGTSAHTTRQRVRKSADIGCGNSRGGGRYTSPTPGVPPVE